MSSRLQDHGKKLEPGFEEVPVVVMILSFNGERFIGRCIQSVLASTYQSFRVVMVDNDSSDDTVPFVRREFPDVSVLEFSSNRGFSAAYNTSIEKVSEQYVILLNQDTEVRNPQWIEELVERAAGDSDCAVVACKLMMREAPEVVNSLGGMAYWWTGPVDIGFGETATPPLNYDFEPFAGSGAAMLVRRDLFLKAGGFDESFFMYCEDLDLCWRLRLLGYRVLLAPKAILLHDFSPGLGRLSPKKVYLVHRNYLRAMLKNFAPSTLLRGLPQFVLFTLLKSVGLAIRGRSLSLLWAPWRAIGWNLRLLRETLTLRDSIQAERVSADSRILRQMGPTGFEPLHSLRRRLQLASNESKV